MYNAEVEGGPRNGVMTALDDFIAEYDRPLRVAGAPDLLRARDRRRGGAPRSARPSSPRRSTGSRAPRAATSSSRWPRRSASGRWCFQHNVVLRAAATSCDRARRTLPRGRQGRAARRALPRERDPPRAPRARRLGTRAARDADQLRDPVRARPGDVRPARPAARRGRRAPTTQRRPSFLPYAAMGRARLDHLERCLDAIARRAGARATSSSAAPAGAAAPSSCAPTSTPTRSPTARVWVADRFRATPEPDRERRRCPTTALPGSRPTSTSSATASSASSLLDDRVRFLAGPAEPTRSPDAPIEQLALLRIGRGAGGDAGGGARRAATTRSSPAAFVVVDEHADRAARSRRSRRSAPSAGSPRRSSASTGRRVALAQGDARERSAPRRTVRSDGGSGTARRSRRRAPADAIDLSVVVVFYNMRREAARTLHSLSRAYQEGIDDVDYEVIVVENGSTHDQKLGAEFVESFGPEFRYLDLGDDATPSPVARAQPRRSARAAARAFALMIDGAHVLTPGVLRFGLAGLAHLRTGRSSPPSSGTSARASRATRWATATTRPTRIASSTTIGWPDDGLPALRDRPLRRRPRLARRRVGEQLHVRAPRRCSSRSAASTRASRCRAAATPTSSSTSASARRPTSPSPRSSARARSTRCTAARPRTSPTPTSGGRAVFGYGEHYAELRGRPFQRPGQADPLRRPHPVAGGAAHQARAACTAEAFADGPRSSEADGPPEQPVPVPDDLQAAFIEAVWRSLAVEPHDVARPSRSQTAPDRPPRLPGDHRRACGPTGSIETGTGDGGRALFLASICELLGHGQVVSIGEHSREDLPRHPRIRYVDGVRAQPTCGRAGEGGRRRQPARSSSCSARVSTSARRARSSRPTRRSSRSARTSSSPTRS